MPDEDLNPQVPAAGDNPATDPQAGDDPVNDTNAGDTPANNETALKPEGQEHVQTLPVPPKAI